MHPACVLHRHGPDEIPDFYGSSRSKTSGTPLGAGLGISVSGFTITREDRQSRHTGKNRPRPRRSDGPLRNTILASFRIFARQRTPVPAIRIASDRSQNQSFTTNVPVNCPPRQHHPPCVPVGLPNRPGLSRLTVELGLLKFGSLKTLFMSNRTSRLYLSLNSEVLGKRTLRPDQAGALDNISSERADRVGVRIGERLDIPHGVFQIVVEAVADLPIVDRDLIGGHVVRSAGCSGREGSGWDCRRW